MQISWSDREQKLKQLNHWDLEGKVAARSATDGGTLSFNWKQNGQNYALSLFGPLGSNTLQIQGQPGQVTLQTPEGKQFSASSAEQLLYKQIGWNLPISFLHYWVRGIPVPGLAAQSDFDAYHRLSKLRQDGWDVWFKQYAVFNGLELPTHILLLHPQLNIKIVIYRWGRV